jgi:hypothetical protein
MSLARVKKAQKVEGKIYPVGSRRPEGVGGIHQYEEHRKENPLTREEWRRVEIEIGKARARVRAKAAREARQTGQANAKKVA